MFFACIFLLIFRASFLFPSFLFFISTKLRDYSFPLCNLPLSLSEEVPLPNWSRLFVHMFKPFLPSGQILDLFSVQCFHTGSGEFFPVFHHCLHPYTLSPVAGDVSTFLGLDTDSKSGSVCFISFLSLTCK